MRASPSTMALRLALALLSFGIVGIVTSALHWTIALNMSEPPRDAAFDMMRITPARLAMAAVAILDVVARAALLFLCVARRHRPFGGLLIPCVVAGVGLFGLAATHASHVVGTALLARSVGARVLAEVTLATSLGNAVAQPLWWLALAGLFVYTAIIVHRERTSAPTAADGAGG